MIDITIDAALQLRAMLRAAGVVGMPAVRIKAEAESCDILFEDRGMPGDEINESRGIRFYVDDATAASMGDVTLDLEGREFVVVPKTA